MKGQKLIAKILTGLLFGVLILSFAVWGIGDIFHGGAGYARNVATVGKVEIGQQEFSRDLSREVNQLSQRLNTRLTMEQAQAFGVVPTVLDRLVSRAVFEQQADDLGMLVTEDQIKQQIADNPTFHDQTGSFSPGRFIQILQSNGLTEGSYIGLLERDTERLQIVGAVTGAVSPPRILAERLYAYDQEKRVADYILIRTDSFDDIPEATDEQIQTFYDENEENFMAPERRSISLFHLRPEDIAEGIEVDEETLLEEFEARQAEFVVPEKRTIEQMVFAEEEKAKEASGRAREGATFEAVSQEFLERAPISLGTMEKSELLDALAEPVFALEKGLPSEPIQSPLGWHVVLVSEIQEGVEPEFEKLRLQLTKDAALSLAVDEIVELANQFDDELAGGATLEEAAATLDMEVRRIDSIDGQGRDADEQQIENLPPLGEFLPVMRETEAGRESLLTETADGGYFALRVESVAPEARRPLEEVRDQVAKLWRGTEQVRLAEEKGRCPGRESQIRRNSGGHRRSRGIGGQNHRRRHAQ